MKRSLLVCVVLCTLPACLLPSPGAVMPPETFVDGEWTGTLESTWGTLPVKATLASRKYSYTLTGTYQVDGQRATGTIYGGLQTSDRDSPALFHGTIDIEYQTGNGATCRNSTPSVSGSVSSTSAVWVATSFTIGQCPDPPMNAILKLRR